ncbi:MAG: molybdenum cofactor biosynthesis protein MoaE [Candidatus Omnitrophica bacterium]|nr:molybdenum cofactor biosynthesis protein MoaE [Candidatus Omnitrophota bacterium]
MTYLTCDPIVVNDAPRERLDTDAGASVEFLGIVRGHEEGRPLASLDYEAYEPMAQRLLARLIEDAKERWALHEVTVGHRLGRVAVGEIAVLIRVRAAHRQEAFEACRFLIDAIKQDVPIWKRPIPC